MPTVSDLKDQARKYEQDGHVRKALAIYQHILRHLEGKPALVKVLPLYVKAGDLLLKQNQRVAAVESYERAAEQYAALGSAPRVSTLCAKIMRADSQRTDVYVHFTRRLMESEHVGSARDVLAGYAELVGLDKALDALDDLAGRSSEEIKPMLERLLVSVGEGERTSAERTAERVSTQLQQVTDVVAGDLIGVSTVELTTGNSGQTEAMPDLTPPLIDLGFSTSPIGVPKPSTQHKSPLLDQRSDVPGRRATDGSVTEAQTSDEEPLTVASASSSIRRDGSDASGPSVVRRGPLSVPTMHMPESIVAMAKPGRSALPYVLIAFILGALIGAGLMWLFATSGSDRGADDQSVGSTATTSVPASSDAANLMSASAESPATRSSRTDSGAETVMDTTTVATLPTAQPDSSMPSGVISGLNSSLYDAGTAGPIVVEGLPIAGVIEIEYRGRTGYRVLHPLNSGGVLTVESFPTGAAAPPSSNVGRISVTLTPPDTLVGIVRLERHTVYASAVIPEDSLRLLMSRLTENGPSN